MSRKNGIAIVTGASSGLGRKFAKLLDKEKFVTEIWIIARRKSLLEELAKELKKPVRIFALDLTSKTDLQAFNKLIKSKNPEISVLVNNAGIGKIGEFADLTLDEELRQINLNIKSVVILTKILLPYINHSGLIINISSVASFMPQPEFATYAATKAFIRSWSLAISKEKYIRDKNIIVTAVYPNPMETEFFRVASKSHKDEKKIKKIGIENPQVVAKKAINRAKRGKNQSIASFIPRLINITSKIFAINFVLWVERKFLKLYS